MGKTTRSRIFAWVIALASPSVALVALVALSGGAGLLSGCAVSDADVRRWETTEQGPRKLYAVITHDKFAWSLRVEAALSLIRMKPRNGKHLAIPLLVDGFKDENGEFREGALIALSPDTRRKMIDSMSEELEKNIEAPPPPKNADGSRPPDPSTNFKDAAFAMLSHDPPLVDDPAVRARLSAAIIQWANADFETRLDTSQQFGIEQMFRWLGASSVKNLPALLVESSTKTDRICSLIHDLGDPDTKQRASVALVTMAKNIDSKAWIDKQRALVEDADRRANQKVTPQQLDQQVQKYQEQELIKVFTAMKKVGGRPSIDYALAYAAEKNNPPERRKAALAALEGYVDKNNPGDVDKLFEVARDDTTPDDVRDLAFQRLGELPKDLVVTKMYTLFNAPQWKVRWVAASLVLKTLSTRGLGDFMARLPKSAATKMGMTEPISYGALIQKMDAPAGEPKPRDAATAFLGSHDLGPKLAALGFFYDGRKGDVGVVQPYENDGTAVPKCEEKDQCGWSCDVPKAPGSQDKETKEIRTVGDFVRFCVIPSMDNP